MASDLYDTVTPFTDATDVHVEELKLKHPPRAAHVQLFSGTQSTTTNTQPISLMLSESAVLVAVRA